ncbi:16686_t:CDS:1, partial [Dentiscutata heterogama]
MRNYIPPECLQLIFYNIQDDRISLHSCLLVNRTWCNNIIGILWKQPFHLLYFCKENTSVKRNLQATNLLETYISCLIQQNKSILVEKSIISQFIKPPMFNYVQYLKFLDLYELYMAIYDYKDSKVNGRLLCRFPLTPKFNSISRRRFPNNQQLDNKVTSEDCALVLNFFFRENLHDLNSSSNNDEYRWLGMFMCKFFLEHSRSIDNLSISARSGLNILTLANQNFISNRKYLNVDDCLMIPTCLDSHNCLSKLTKLVCTTRYRKANFLSNLASICHCIKTLIIRVDCDIAYSWPIPILPTSRNVEHESVAKLIKSQRGLVQFELQYCSTGLGNIMTTLKSQ